MTYEEYDARKRQIKKEADEAIDRIKSDAKKAIDELARECTRSNNTVKIGDIVSGNGFTIKVERIVTYMPYMGNYPACAYHGPRLTKTGEPYKSGEICVVWQTIEK